MKDIKYRVPLLFAWLCGLLGGVSFSSAREPGVTLEIRQMHVPLSNLEQVLQYMVFLVGPR